jgi:hypothetical protein
MPTKNELTLDASGAALAGHDSTALVEVRVARAVLLDNRNNEVFYPREHTCIMLSTSDKCLKGK